MELGFRSSVGTPIVFAGRVWGALMVHSTRPQPLPADTESRVAAVAELVATAISNAEARAEVARLADEQAALRRVATLVARQPSPDEVFGAVAEETGRLLPIEDTAMLRYEDDGTATVVATSGERGDALKVGTRMPVGGENVTARVHRTGRPARIDDCVTASGAVGSHLGKLGTRSAVGCPIEVDGSLWGVLVVAQGVAEPLPAGIEARLEKFAELVATAISNVQVRSDLAASRARIVAATDDERRRVVRDLHDGAQQRLVHTVVTLKLARRTLERDEKGAGALVSEALAQAERATAELRELSHGILPAVLTRGGLRAGVEALATRMPVPVDIGVAVGRLPPTVEATAYFVVAEALTNVAKHARAQRAEVNARVEGGSLHVHVRDDGVGGAQPHGGGLVGLDDRLAVLNGQLRIDSPANGGTVVAAASRWLLSDRHRAKPRRQRPWACVHALGGHRNVRGGVRAASPDVVQELLRAPRRPALGIDQVVRQHGRAGDRVTHLRLVQIAAEQQRVGRLAHAFLLGRPQLRSAHAAERLHDAAVPHGSHSGHAVRIAAAGARSIVSQSPASRDRYRSSRPRPGRGRGRARAGCRRPRPLTDRAGARISGGEAGRGPLRRLLDDLLGNPAPTRADVRQAVEARQQQAPILR
jgi:signal transduction histidine kinase